MAKIGQIATNIYDNEFDDEPTQLKREFKIEAISGWLEGNLGQFNNLTYTSFATTGEFKLEEENILTQLYLKDYYTKEARKVLSMGATGSLEWTRLTEGDTTIVRTNKVDTARTYRLMAKDAGEALEKLIYSYNSYQAAPVQSAGYDGGFISGSGYYQYPFYFPPY
tara:strand:+ start:515 stop:1012 length:498 start_codon:yes stop_codon:yes gene_type:complete